MDSSVDLDSAWPTSVKDAHGTSKTKENAPKVYKSRFTFVLCPMPDCDVRFHSIPLIQDHLRSVHEIGLESERLYFKDFAAFENWKTAESTKIGCSFLMNQRKNKTNRVFNYYCGRFRREFLKYTNGRTASNYTKNLEPLEGCVCTAKMCVWLEDGPDDVERFGVDYFKHHLHVVKVPEYILNLDNLKIRLTDAQIGKIIGDRDLLLAENDIAVDSLLQNEPGTSKVLGRILARTKPPAQEGIFWPKVGDKNGVRCPVDNCDTLSYSLKEMEEHLRVVHQDCTLEGVSSQKITNEPRTEDDAAVDSLLNNGGATNVVPPAQQPAKKEVAPPKVGKKYGINCPVDKCNGHTYFMRFMQRHLRNVHQAGTMSTKIYFDTQEEFDKWLEEEIERVGCNFLKLEQKARSYSAYNFVCAKFKRAMIRQQEARVTSKYTKHLEPLNEEVCTANMRITLEEVEDGVEKIAVLYYPQHLHEVKVPELVLKVEELHTLPSLIITQKKEKRSERQRLQMKIPNKMDDFKRFWTNRNYETNTNLTFVIASEAAPEEADDATAPEPPPEPIQKKVPVKQLCDVLCGHMSALVQDLQPGLPRAMTQKLQDLCDQHEKVMDEMKSCLVSIEPRVHPPQQKMAVKLVGKGHTKEAKTQCSLPRKERAPESPIRPRGRPKTNSAVHKPYSDRYSQNTNTALSYHRQYDMDAYNRYSYTTPNYRANKDEYFYESSPRNASSRWNSSFLDSKMSHMDSYAGSYPPTEQNIDLDLDLYYDNLPKRGLGKYAPPQSKQKAVTEKYSDVEVDGYYNDTPAVKRGLGKSGPQYGASSSQSTSRTNYDRYDDDADDDDYEDVEPPRKATKYDDSYTTTYDSKFSYKSSTAKRSQDYDYSAKPAKQSSRYARYGTSSGAQYGKSTVSKKSHGDSEYNKKSVKNTAKYGAPSGFRHGNKKSMFNTSRDYNDDRFDDCNAPTPSSSVTDYNVEYGFKNDPQKKVPSQRQKSVSRAKKTLQNDKVKKPKKPKKKKTPAVPKSKFVFKFLKKTKASQEGGEPARPRGRPVENFAKPVNIKVPDPKDIKVGDKVPIPRKRNDFVYIRPAKNKINPVRKYNKPALQGKKAFSIASVLKTLPEPIPLQPGNNDEPASEVPTAANTSSEYKGPIITKACSVRLVPVKIRNLKPQKKQFDDWANPNVYKRNSRTLRRGLFEKVFGTSGDKEKDVLNDKDVPKETPPPPPPPVVKPKKKTTPKKQPITKNSPYEGMDNEFNTRTEIVKGVKQIIYTPKSFGKPIPSTTAVSQDQHISCAPTRVQPHRTRNKPKRSISPDVDYVPKRKPVVKRIRSPAKAASSSSKESPSFGINQSKTPVVSKAGQPSPSSRPTLPIITVPVTPSTNVLTNTSAVRNETPVSYTLKPVTVTELQHLLLSRRKLDGREESPVANPPSSSHISLKLPVSLPIDNSSNANHPPVE